MLETSDLLSENKETLSSLIATKLTESVNSYEVIIQLTKRTKLKQQQTLNRLEEMAKPLKEDYKSAAEKILQWIEYKFLSSELNKIIIDISPGGTIENNEIDLRITFYENSRPTDLNLIFKDEPGHLKKLNWADLKEHLQCIAKINSDFETIIAQQDNFLQKLASFLESTDNKKLIKKFFKRITASPAYYEIIIDSDILIVDFSKIELPTTLKVNYNQADNLLCLNFDNQFHLKCELQEIEKELYFIVRFKNIPKDLELISV